MKSKCIKLLDNVKKSDNWGTPKNIFDVLNLEFNFTLDVCAHSKEIAKCEKFFNPEQNGLIQDWSHDICFMNPPYSNVSQWMKKAYEESLKGAVVVALTFAKTDTKWFHEYCIKNEIRFLKGRIKFINYNSDKKINSPAPFGSMITIFKKDETQDQT